METFVASFFLNYYNYYSIKQSEYTELIHQLKVNNQWIISHTASSNSHTHQTFPFTLKRMLM